MRAEQLNCKEGYELLNNKIKIIDKSLFRNFSKILSIISTIFALVSPVIPFNNSIWWRVFYGILFVVLVVVAYFISWKKANKQERADLIINNTNVSVVEGDIFELNGLKVISFNEYFDTIIDDRVISKTSLHGKWLEKYKDKMCEFEEVLNNDLALKESLIDYNSNRISGNKNRYKLGSLVEFDEYVLTAFTKFDDKNEAYHTSESYIEFWMSFWKNIDAIYAGRVLNIPLMGAGMTRFHSVELSKQELLEIMLTTLRISGFKNTYPDAKINFVIYSDDMKDIDFYHIQQRFGKRD